MRAFAVAALVALDVSTATAQSTRHFKDSWFWGLKGGAMSYQVMSDTVGNAIAPMAGIDWMITRSKGGLYVAFDQAFLSQYVFVNDSLSPLDTVPRQVNLFGMRRFTLAGMLFPMQSDRVHPYVGFGVTLNSIARATPLGTYRNGTQQKLVQSTVAQFKTAGAPVIFLGTQLKVPLTSAFVQASATPANNNFFLFTGTNWRVTLEAGLRYNAGSSIDRMR